MSLILFFCFLLILDALVWATIGFCWGIWKAIQAILRAL